MQPRWQWNLLPVWPVIPYDSAKCCSSADVKVLVGCGTSPLRLTVHRTWRCTTILCPSLERTGRKKWRKQTVVLQYCSYSRNVFLFLISLFVIAEQSVKMGEKPRGQLLWWPLPSWNNCVAPWSTLVFLIDLTNSRPPRKKTYVWEVRVVPSNLTQ